MQWEPGKRYQITYRDESYEETRRTIDVLGTSRSRDGRLFIRAFCNLRGEERTFRGDRVIRAERLVSGLSLPWAERPASSAQTATMYTPKPSAAAIQWNASETPPYQPGASIASPGCPPIPAAAQNAPAAKQGGTGGLWVLGLLVGMAIPLGVLLYANSVYPSFPSTPERSYVVPPKPEMQRTPPPKPAIEEVTIAGRLLKTIRGNGLERFEVPSLGLVTSSKLEAVAAIRMPVFIDTMGFFDAALTSRYLDADLNGSGRLSFDELKVFQDRTFRTFRYEANEFALRPDEFLATGGGDCEDFALYTAGLLRFWGWEPYIASFAGSKDGYGHAVCLSYEEGAFPAGYAYFQIDSWTTEDGSALKPGSYVPIDYDHVGSLSDAVLPGWKLRSVYTPEKTWGLEM